MPAEPTSDAFTLYPSGVIGPWIFGAQGQANSASVGSQGQNDGSWRNRKTARGQPTERKGARPRQLYSPSYNCPPMADRFDDATQVQSLSCFTRTFNISDALVHSLEGAPGFPRPGAGAGACPAVYPHVYQYVLGQVRSRYFLPPSHHSYTIAIYRRCITGTPSTRFSRGEESCLANCVDRFLDTSLFIVKKIESQRLGA